MSDFNERVIEAFRANGGEVGAWGRGLVLIHHVGAKSGQRRVSPAMSIRDDADTWLVAASKGGAPQNPAWFHNLLAHPDAEIETADDGTVPIHATVLQGAARDEAWQRFTELSDGFRQYEARTTRVIPVVELRRRA